MEPTATLAEIARILRPGGLFAAYDYDWPPTLHWELDRLAQEVSQHLLELVRERGLAQNFKIWSKRQHLDHMRRECSLPLYSRGVASSYRAKETRRGFLR